MAPMAGEVLRGTRAPAPTRSRLPSGQLRQPGHAYADDPRPTIAELATTPLDFLGGHTDLPCQDPHRGRWWFAPEEEPGMEALGEWHAEQAQAACRPCPLLLECRRYGLANRAIRHGIWGGVRLSTLSAKTRTMLLAETRAALRRRRTA